MTLENLLAIHRLQAFEATPGGVLRLLASAERNLADARLSALSNDNRFDAAVCECITQAEALLADTRQWLRRNRPDLLAENT
jgi:hypothetical protein